MVASSSSGSTTALKWWFAVEMRRLREKCRISREQAAAAVKGSPQNIGHIEVGRTLPKPLELDRLLELYGVPERQEFFQELRNRAKRGRDWWIGLGDSVPVHLNLFLGLESSAVQIETIEGDRVTLAAGLREDTLVVSSGAAELRDGERVRVVGEE